MPWGVPRGPGHTGWHHGFPREAPSGICEDLTQDGTPEQMEGLDFGADSTAVVEVGDVEGEGGSSLAIGGIGTKVSYRILQSPFFLIPFSIFLALSLPAVGSGLQASRGQDLVPHFILWASECTTHTFGKDLSRE